MKRAILLLWVSSTLGACSLDLHANHDYCESDADCEAGERCVAFDGTSTAGLCVVEERDAGMDGGRELDAGSDAGGCQDGVDCYSGPDGTRDVGTCRAGAVECRDGVAFCMGEVTPEPDTTCNSTDEDCDGTADDDAPPLMECAIAQPGVCAAGEVRCVDGAYACRPVNEAMPERCNAMDDDCDEVVDEDTDLPCYPSDAPRGCTIEADGSFTCTGVCLPGRLSCTAGVASCDGATLPADGDDCSTSEPALDDDCDGAIDQDCADTCTDGATRTCYSGPASAAGQGICELGMQTCTAGTWSSCVGSVLPSEESCSNPGTDDDCDGVTDDIEGQGLACLDMAAMGVCRTGAFMCDASSTLTCVTPTPAATEACDGRDDDCDGAVDEIFDFMTDEDNCGTCGRSCGPGRTCCGGTCVDTSRDIANCGDCGTMCDGTSEGCCGGMCMDVLADEANCGACGNLCPGTNLCCDGACVDQRSDIANCGACSAGCTGTDTCCDGICADPGSTQCTDCLMDCTADQTCCAPSCADLDGDPANCGSCGNACAEPADTCCGGGCVDTAIDEANCGSCGMACGGATPDCCDSGCVDLESDIFHCGACGTTCEAGQVCCSGACVDLTTNHDNCGTCGMSCRSSESCTSSECCPTGQTSCDGTCVDTSTSFDNCGSCGRSCGAGQICCGGSCVNPQNDPSHCGSCTACTTGDDCSGAHCCPAGQTWCAAAGACFNLQTNPDHCGSCTTMCGGLTQHCRSGRCGL